MTDNTPTLSTTLSVTEKGGLEENGESVFMRTWKPMEYDSRTLPFIGKVLLALAWFFALTYKLLS